MPSVPRTPRRTSTTSATPASDPVEPAPVTDGPAIPPAPLDDSAAFPGSTVVYPDATGSLPTATSATPFAETDPAEPADDLNDEPAGNLLYEHQAVCAIHRNLAEDPVVVFRPTESVTPRISILRDVWVDLGSPTEITVSVRAGNVIPPSSPPTDGL